MTTLTEGVHANEFRVSEANGDRSREVVTIVSGENLKAGHVLGKITASGKYAEHDPAAVDGTETAVAVLYDDTDASAADTKAVAYVRDCELNGDLLTYIAGISAPNKAAAIADLAGVGIHVR